MKKHNEETHIIKILNDTELGLQKKDILKISVLLASYVPSKTVGQNHKLSLLVDKTTNIITFTAKLDLNKI